MFKLTLPIFVGGRALPNTYVDKFDGDLRDAEVLVDAYQLQAGSPSFAAELVHRLLVREGVRTLHVTRAPRPFAEYMQDAAAKLGVEDQLQITDSTRPEVSLHPLADAAATSRAR